MVSFTIPGRITSANRVTRRVGNRSLKSASARADCERIAAYATAAKAACGWSVPDVAELAIVAFNSRLDAGNVEKVIGDGIKGVLIVDDNPRHLRRLVVEHQRDGAGERYVVSVAQGEAAR